MQASYKSLEPLLIKLAVTDHTHMGAVRSDTAGRKPVAAKRLTPTRLEIHLHTESGCHSSGQRRCNACSYTASLWWRCILPRNLKHQYQPISCKMSVDRIVAPEALKALFKTEMGLKVVKALKMVSVIPQYCSLQKSLHLVMSRRHPPTRPARQLVLPPSSATWWTKQTHHQVLHGLPCCS